MTQPAWGYGAYEPPLSKRGRPAVILWYRAFAVVMALAYGACAVLAGFATVSFPDQGEARLMMAACTLVLFALTAVYAVAAFIPYKPWGWSFGIVAIALSFFAGPFPIAIALLVYWIKPEAKAAFARI